MRIDWARSAPLTLALVNGADVRLVCGPNYRAATAFAALFKPSQWIYLEPEEDRATG